MMSKCASIGCHNPVTRRGERCDECRRRDPRTDGGTDIGAAAPRPAIHDGITVCHKSEPHDVYGGRGTQQSHLLNTPVGERGWLGNPYRLRDYDDDREQVIVNYVPRFYDRLEADRAFRDAVLALDGQRVACWCRHADEHAPPCHLDVIDQFLQGGRLYVSQWLAEQFDVPVQPTETETEVRTDGGTPTLADCRPLGIPAPEDCAERLGYRGANRYVATWWTNGGDEAMVSDGYTTHDGDWRAYVSLQRELGEQLLREAGYTPEDDLGLPTPLDVILRRTDGIELGSSEDRATHALLVDTATRQLYVGERETVATILHERNDREDTTGIDGELRDVATASPEGIR